MTPRLAILNGPNLDRLGRRELNLYGPTTYDELVGLCHEWAAELACEVVVHQANGEGELVGLIHTHGDTADAVILNAAGYTHTSVAVRDAVASVAAPVIELHITNPWSREAFRRRSLLADVVAAGIHGFGIDGYRLALVGAVGLLA